MHRQLAGFINRYPFPSVTKMKKARREITTISHSARDKTRRRKESMSDSVPVADVRETSRPAEYLDCAPARRRLGIIDAREARPVLVATGTTRRSD